MKYSNPGCMYKKKGGKAFQPCLQRQGKVKVPLKRTSCVGKTRAAREGRSGAPICHFIKSAVSVAVADFIALTRYRHRDAAQRRRRETEFFKRL